MVDIVYLGLAVDEADEAAYDFGNVILGEDPCVLVGVQAQLLVEAVPSDHTKVVPFLREEQLVDDIPGSRFIRRFRIAELFVDEVDGFLFGVGRILLKSPEDALELLGGVLAFFIVLVEEDRLHVGLPDLFDALVIEGFASLYNDFASFYRDGLSGVFVLEVLVPGPHDLGGEGSALVLFEILVGDFHLVGYVEDIGDFLVGTETDRPQQSGYRKLLLTVDVGPHHVVDVGRELDP